MNTQLLSQASTRTGTVQFKIPHGREGGKIQDGGFITKPVLTPEPLAADGLQEAVQRVAIDETATQAVCRLVHHSSLRSSRNYTFDTVDKWKIRNSLNLYLQNLQRKDIFLNQSLALSPPPPE
jgi:hypothetical protein